MQFPRRASFLFPEGLSACGSEREGERARDTRCKRGREVGEMERDGRGQGETEVRQLRKKHVTSQRLQHGVELEDMSRHVPS